MSLNGRIAACGAISGYNAGGAFNNNLTNWAVVVLMRVQIKGFMQSDFPAVEADKARDLLQTAILEGRIKVAESQTVVECKLEDVPRTWLRLFDGQNIGKLVTKLD